VTPIGSSPEQPRRRGAWRDLAPIAGIAAAVLVAGSFAGVWIELYEFAHQRYQDSLGVLMAFVTVCAFAFAAFSFRRGHQLERESRLRETSEARYRAVVERVPAITYTWDPTKPAGVSVISYLSPQIERILGYSSEEWTEDPGLWVRCLHPDDRERVVRQSDAADATGRDFVAEYRVIAKDGGVVWVHDESVIVEWDEDGRPSLAQGAMFDITRRKHAEQRLQETENRYRTLVERVPAVAYVWDSGYELGTQPDAYISPRIEELVGFTPQEWARTPGLWARQVHPDDLEDVLALRHDAVRRAEPFAAQYRLLRKDGGIVWVRDEAVPVSEGARGLPVYQGVILDVTEHKDAEARLVSAEAELRRLVEQLPVVTYLANAGTGEGGRWLRYIAPGVSELTGHAPDEWLRDTGLWTRLLHQDDRERVVAEAARTELTRERFDVEYRIVRKDGRVVWLHDVAVHSTLDDDGVWLGALEDVTERKRAEDERRLAEERYRSLIEELPTVVYIDAIDEVSTALYVSPRYERLTGYSPEERIADPDLWVRMLHPDDRERVLAESLRTNETGDPFDVEYRLIRKDGGTVWVHDHAVLVGGEEASPRFWQGVLSDVTAEKESGQQLRRTEERFRTLVEQLPAITYIDEFAEGEEDWPTVYISPQLSAILGYDPEEWKADHHLWQSLLHPDDLERAIEADRIHRETGAPLVQEVRVFARDGSIKWLRDEAILIRDDRGRPRWSQGIFIDITERKEAEERLHEAEERYRSLVETIPAAIYIDAVDELSKGIYMSPQVEQIFGYPPEDWLARPELWEQGLHPDDREEVVERIERLNRDGVPFEAEYRFDNPRRGWVWVQDQAVVIRGEDGTPLFAQGVMFDVTQRKQAQDQLREAEERFRAIVEHVPAAIYLDLPDDSMQTIYVSPQIEQITGIRPDQWRAENDVWIERMHPEDRERVAEGYLDAITNRRTWDAEYRFVRPDGKVVWVHDETTFLHDENGNDTFLQGVLFDITEQKLAEQALRDSEQREREAAERLRALDEMKNTFLAAVSHELRSPLTSILGLSLTLERQASALPVDEQADLLDRLAMNARKLDRLLKDLLDIDRLNRGIVTPQYRVTDVGALAVRTVESLEALADRSVELQVEMVVLSVDPAKVERIVENLLVNAVRHTQPHARIWLSVGPAEGGVLIAVDDDGPGVPQDLREAIFEPFRQGPTPSKASPGTGIGLSLVARFAELHGGRAWVEEREGGGASFRVLLPPGPADGGMGSGPANGELAATRFDPLEGVPADADVAR
jgi:PAS domain S-box-containing protein